MGLDGELGGNNPNILQGFTFCLPSLASRLGTASGYREITSHKYQKLFWERGRAAFLSLLLSLQFPKCQMMGWHDVMASPESISIPGMILLY